MTEDAVLKRIDRTLDRIDARLERGDRRWEEERREWKKRDREWKKRDEEWKKLTEENRRFHDALMERHARITQDQIGAIAAIREQSAADSAALQAEIAEQRAEIKGQTEALLKLIDRLPPNQRPQG